MSEHIKTGKILFGEMYLEPTDFNKIGDEQWVSLSWLKDIEKHNPLLTIEDVLSLLEEK